MLKASSWSKNMHPPKKQKHKCECDIVATSAKQPTICMTCDGQIG